MAYIVFFSCKAKRTKIFYLNLISNCKNNSTDEYLRLIDKIFNQEDCICVSKIRELHMGRIMFSFSHMCCQWVATRRVAQEPDRGVETPSRELHMGRESSKIVFSSSATLSKTRKDQFT